MYLTKKFLIIFFSFCLISSAFADFSLTTMQTEIQKKQATLSLTAQKQYLQKTILALRTLEIKNLKNPTQYANILAVKAFVTQQLTALSSGISMSIPKVDLTKVRTTWLALHNAERKLIGLTGFTYSSPLEGTATSRATSLSQKGTATHQRTASDGYYNYTSIKTWFADQGITFASQEKNGQALFTENLGRGYYTCTKTDCTDDFITAITKSRTFFMNEKGKTSNAHYRAIIGNYSSLGLGVALSGGKYYLVSHYTQPLK